MAPRKCRRASTQKQVKSISDIEFARKIALDLLSIRPRSEAELRTALAKRNVPDELIDELCGRFTEVGLLDDAQFASMLVASRSSFSHHGKRRIRQSYGIRECPMSKPKPLWTSSMTTQSSTPPAQLRSVSCAVCLGSNPMWPNVDWPEP